MCCVINKQLLLTAYAYLFIMEQQKVLQGSEALQMKEKNKQEFKEGTIVEYECFQSSAASRWIPTEVVSYDAEKDTYDLKHKQNVPQAKIRQSTPKVGSIVELVDAQDGHLGPSTTTQYKKGTQGKVVQIKQQDCNRTIVVTRWPDDVTKEKIHLDLNTDFLEAGARFKFFPADVDFPSRGDFMNLESAALKDLEDVDVCKDWEQALQQKEISNFFPGKQDLDPLNSRLMATLFNPGLRQCEHAAELLVSQVLKMLVPPKNEGEEEKQKYQVVHPLMFMTPYDHNGALHVDSQKLVHDIFGAGHGALPLVLWVTSWSAVSKWLKFILEAASGIRKGGVSFPLITVVAHGSSSSIRLAENDQMTTSNVAELQREHGLFSNFAQLLGTNGQRLFVLYSCCVGSGHLPHLIAEQFAKLENPNISVVAPKEALCKTDFKFSFEPDTRRWTCAVNSKCGHGKLRTDCEDLDCKKREHEMILGKNVVQRTDALLREKPMDNPPLTLNQIQQATQSWLQKAKQLARDVYNELHPPWEVPANPFDTSEKEEESEHKKETQRCSEELKKAIGAAEATIQELHQAQAVTACTSIAGAIKNPFL